MRNVLTCMLITVGVASFAEAADRTDLTIIVEFEGAHSSGSVNEMKRETQGIMKDSGLRLNWRLRSEVARDSFPNLVVVRFKGKCILEPVAALYDERGPFAFTYSTDGVVLPFSEVACDNVTASMRSAMWGADFGRTDLLMGRALGRVVAHELVHILTHSGAHGREGVAKPALSGEQLISATLPLSREDLQRLRQELAKP